jgi:hypothetical protein
VEKSWKENSYSRSHHEQQTGAVRYGASEAGAIGRCAWLGSEVREPTESTSRSDHDPMSHALS